MRETRNDRNNIKRTNIPISLLFIDKRLYYVVNTDISAEICDTDLSPFVNDKT